MNVFKRWRHATPFVDRARLHERLATTLANGDARLLALVGPMGAGKTRLGLELLATLEDVFRDGIVATVELREHELVTAGIARVLGVPNPAHIARVLSEAGPSVLFFDGAITGAEMDALANLAEGAPEARFVVTSVENPRHASFRTCVLPPLERPSTPTDLEASESGRVFDGAARHRSYDWTSEEERQAIFRLLEKLGALPLTVEMLAAECAIVGARTLASRLASAKEWLGPPRGRRDAETLRASFDRLPAQLRETLRALLCFRGAFTVNDAEAICAAPVLPALLQLHERSWLINFGLAAGPPRFEVLGALRFAIEQDVDKGVRARHIGHFLRAHRGADFDSKLAFDDVLFACDAATAERDVEAAVDALFGCFDAARGLGRMSDLGATAARVADRALGLIKARALGLVARAARERGEFTRAADALDEAERLARRGKSDALRAEFACCRAGLAFKRGHYDEIASLSPYEARSVVPEDVEAFAMGASIRGEHAVAAQLYAKAIAASDREQRVRDAAVLRACAARLHVESGSHARAESYLADLERAPHDPMVVASIVTTRAMLAHDRRSYDEAIISYDEAIGRYRRLGSPLVPYLTQVRALATFTTTRAAEARAAFIAARQTHSPGMIHLLPIATLGDWLLEGIKPPDDVPEDSVVRTTQELIVAFIAAESRGDRTRLARARQRHAPLERWSVVSRAIARLLEDDVKPIAKKTGTFLVDEHHRWFAPPDGPVVSLATRPMLRRVLEALVTARLHQPGRKLKTAEISAEVWPGERMSEASRRARVYVAVSTLKQIGLGPVLLSTRAGYALDPEVHCVLSIPLERHSRR